MTKFVVMGIRDQAKTLKEWYNAGISGDDVLADLYSRFSMGELDGKCLSLNYETAVADVRVGKSAAGTFTKVPPETKVDDVVSVLGIYIDFCANKISNFAESFRSFSEST